MLSYLLISWRNILKNRVTTAIHTIGLAVAFTSCILLFLLVHYEFSFDGFQRNMSRLYKVYNVTWPRDGADKRTGMSYPVTPALKTEVPGIAAVTGYMDGGHGLRYKGKLVDQSVELVDSDFFRMFSFPIVQGDRQAPLGNVNDIVLSESTSKAVFGSENPIGKTLSVKFDDDSKDLVVSAVIEDMPQNSSIRYQSLARMEISPEYVQYANEWNSTNHWAYVMLDPHYTQAQVEAELRSVVARHMITSDVVEKVKAQGYKPDANGDYLAIKLAPFPTLHFDGEIGSGPEVNKTYLYVLTLIGIIVLCIACFNFINLNVARAFTRAKEVGIRKTIGAGKTQIFFHLWIESLVLCLGSVIIATLVAEALLNSFNALFVEHLSGRILFEPGILMYILAGTVLVSFLAGGYPALVMSRFEAVEVLKGKVVMRGTGWLRNGLITFQFVMAGLLILGTIVIYRQFDHLRKAPLGFSQESIISIPVKDPANGGTYLRELRAQLASQSEVPYVTGASANIGIGEDGGISSSHRGWDYKGGEVRTLLLTVDYDFLKTLGLPVLQGRDFSRAFPSDTSSKERNIIVSQSMAKELGMANPVGLSFWPDSTKPRWNVIGLIPDFHLYTMNQVLEPLTLVMHRDSVGNRLEYLMVKVRTANPIQALAMVKNAYHSIEPDNPSGPSYLTENTRRWYEKEERLAHIFMSAAGIAIALSCLGLFAMVSLIVEQRRKEIGVRKVLGASVPRIVTLLSTDFIKVVALSWLIACPIAGYFLSRWLQGFLYRVSLDWWIFAVTGATMGFIALCTVSAQTIRSALANPVKSLRTE